MFQFAGFPKKGMYGHEAKDDLIIVDIFELKAREKKIRYVVRTDRLPYTRHYTHTHLHPSEIGFVPNLFVCPVFSLPSNSFLPFFYIIPARILFSFSLCLGNAGLCQDVSRNFFLAHLRIEHEKGTRRMQINLETD